ncbi:MAG TPA: GH1 family beta-glucosidase [Solirubrobacteraceae bacterium]|nr:GH1 family beta-glucosidase [Solirubrobacteraceae bacterium]
MTSLASGSTPGARRFPDGFIWGTGTSSYQIEGAVAADGRGRSIWDVFAHTPGKTFRGDTGDVACDSYNLMDEDVRIIRDLGVGAYRFSIAWPRVQPTGSGAINRAGLDYYRRLSERLREVGVAPIATVYHWDLPQALEDLGGWTARETAQRMGEFAEILGQELGDLVQTWITINEPLQTVHQGYRVGTHAPGVCDMALAAAATHHILLGHGLVLQALRAATPAGTEIGPTMDPQPAIALDPGAEAAAVMLDAEHNRVYMDPVLARRYPEEARPEFLPPAELIRDGDLEIIGAPIDFFGVNYYRPHYIRSADWADLRLGEQPIPGLPGIVEYMAPDLPRTVMGWPIVPAGLRDLLRRVHAESGGLKLYITENGCAADDYVGTQGTVDDYERIDYIHAHLEAAWEAIQDGVNLCGYFHWSLMDNFEWAEGYRRRFGLHYVDFETRRRIPKRSAHFYGQIARTGVLPAREQALPAGGTVSQAPAAPVGV